MDNEINLFDMLLAKKLGGGGTTPTGEIAITENGTYDVTNYASANVDVQTHPAVIQAETFSQLVIPSFHGPGWNRAGTMQIRLGTSTNILPILFTVENGNYFISGGATNGAGEGAAFVFTYTPDTPGATFIEAYIATGGIWADMTQHIASMASNIAILRYPI